MTIIHPARRRALLLGGAAVVAAACSPGRLWAAPAAPLPSDSLYQLALTLTDQTGRSQGLDAHRGQALLVSMFYASCPFVCPMLVETMKNTQAGLAPQERARLGLLMVSVDPERDSVAALGQLARQRELDAPQWTLARTDARSVRKLAAALGIQYRALANGDFNHTTALILLDAEGRIVARSTQLGPADPAFVDQVRVAVQRAAR